MLVDGPPAHIGPNARYPAVPMLFECMASRCVVVLDDAYRQAERRIAAQWARDKHMTTTCWTTSRGQWVLRREWSPYVS
jgi:hypothetical protein